MGMSLEELCCLVELAEDSVCTWEDTREPLERLRRRGYATSEELPQTPELFIGGGYMTARYTITPRGRAAVERACRAAGEEPN